MASATGGFFLLPALTTERLARAAVSTKNTAKYCIFVMMRGGPSQIDTFDFKEGPWMPASLRPASYGDIRWPQGLMPKLADQLGSVALIRSMRSWAAVHVLAQSWVQIGRNPAAAASRIAPHVGSVVSMELARPNAMLPAFVFLNTGSGIGAGYLPPKHNPFFMTPNGSALANTRHPDGNERFDRRYGLLLAMDAELRTSEPLGIETVALVISEQVDKLGVVTDPSFAFRACSNGPVCLPRRFVSYPCRASIRNPCFAPSDRRPPAFRQARQVDRRGPLSLGLAILDLDYGVAIPRFHHETRHSDRLAT
jgi:hypothetical protein